jgi:hypothetical protein
MEIPDKLASRFIKLSDFVNKCLLDARDGEPISEYEFSVIQRRLTAIHTELEKLLKSL